MKFQPGSSGNPRGRKPGTGHRQQLFNALVAPHRDALFNAAIQLALGGNEAMLRLFLDRMLPAKPSDDTVTVAIPDRLNRPSTLASCGEAVLNTVAEGTLTPKQGASIMGCLEAQRKIVETCELAQRIDEIERTLKQRPRTKRD